MVELAAFLIVLIVGIPLLFEVGAALLCLGVMAYIKIRQEYLNIKASLKRSLKRA